MQQKRSNRSRTSRGRGRKQRFGPVMARDSVPPLFPATRRVSLVYTLRKAFGESSTAAGGAYTYAINNLYDPDKTGIGNQPINFDQISALYTLFRVVSVDYDIEMINVATTAGATATVGIVPSWNDALPTDPFAWFGLPYSRQKLLSNLGGSNIAKFTGRIEPWRVLSLPKRQYMSSPDYTCTATGSPARQVYLSTFCVGSGAVGAILSTVRFIFHVECMIPVLNTVS